MSLPRAPDRLSDEMAQALGHAVAGFGFLEEALKRAIFSLTRQGLSQDADDAALQKWLRRMEEIADDSLGTLIDSFVAAIGRARIDDRHLLAEALTEIRLKRNLLCHASWRPADQPGYWHPTFINTRGERYPDDMNARDIRDIHAATLRVARRVVSIMRATGIDGEWAGHDEEDQAMRLTLDYPPVWLAGSCAVAWGLGRLVPHGPGWQGLPGWILVLAGLSVMITAAATMWRKRTTLDPHGQPAALVTTGVFALSRNPIYLGDALILAGLCLIFAAPVAALILVPVFMIVISRRFIAGEEARLATAFPDMFAQYRAHTRRWI